MEEMGVAEVGVVVGVKDEIGIGLVVVVEVEIGLVVVVEVGVEVGMLWVKVVVEIVVQVEGEIVFHYPCLVGR